MVTCPISILAYPPKKTRNQDGADGSPLHPKENGNLTLTISTSQKMPQQLTTAIRSMGCIDQLWTMKATQFTSTPLPPPYPR